MQPKLLYFDCLRYIFNIFILFYIVLCLSVSLLSAISVFFITFQTE